MAKFHDFHHFFRFSEGTILAYMILGNRQTIQILSESNNSVFGDIISSPKHVFIFKNEKVIPIWTCTVFFCKSVSKPSRVFIGSFKGCLIYFWNPYELPETFFLSSKNERNFFSLIVQITNPLWGRFTRHSIMISKIWNVHMGNRQSGKMCFLPLITKKGKK